MIQELDRAKRGENGPARALMKVMEEDTGKVRDAVRGGSRIHVASLEKARDGPNE